MNKYIFFRTDRIGDFLLSAVLIKSIKRNDPSSHITVVSSKKNYNFIKDINFVDTTIIYPEKVIDRLKFFFTLINKKYFFSCVLDGKKRSIYANILIRAKIKIACTNKIFFMFIFYFFFKKILIDSDHFTKIDEIKSILKILNFNYEDNDLNILTERKYNQSNVTEFLSNKENFILFHFDEKWIYKQYLKSYITIEPNSYLDLINFFEKIANKTNNNLIISSGNRNNKFIENFKNDFSKINTNIYNFNNSKVFFLNNLSMKQLEFVISKCSTIVSCHGAPTHIAGAFNKKIIDIIDVSEKLFFVKWSAHFRKYEQLHRFEFSKLSEIILSKILNK